VISSVAKSRPVSWWYAAVLYASSVIMELCWLSAIVLFINDRSHMDLSVPALWLIYLISFGLNFGLKGLKWHKALFTLSNWIAWLVVMLLAVKLLVFGDMAWTNPYWLGSLLCSIPDSIYGLRPELLFLLYSLLVWWPAKWLAFRKVGFSSSVLQFQFGLVILILVSAIASALGLDPQYSTPAALKYLIPVTVLFFAVGLIGISLAHSQQGRGWSGSLSRSRWSWLVIINIVLILAAGLAIAFIVSPGLLKMIVSGIAWVFTEIMYLLSLLARLFPVGDVSQALPPSANMTSGGPDINDIWHIPEDVRFWLNVGWGTLFFGFLAVAIWQICSQVLAWMRRRSISRAGGAESLKGAFKEDFIAFLRSIIKGIVWTISKLKFKRDEASREQATVQQFYRRLLKWGQRKGCPRQSFQTPYEYLEGIAALLPPATADLSLITDCFVRSCYGRSLPGPDELRHLGESWERIKKNRYARQDKSPARNRRKNG
jgi:hypothetical protein